MPISDSEGLEVEVVRQLLVGELEHDLGEELVVLLPERHHEQQHELADARVDLAHHAAVEEVHGVLSAQRRLPGCGSAWKNPSTSTWR